MLWWQRSWNLYGCLTEVLSCSLARYQKTAIQSILIYWNKVTTDKPLIALLLWTGSWCWALSMNAFLQSKQFWEKCALLIFFCVTCDAKKATETLTTRLTGNTVTQTKTFVKFIGARENIFLKEVGATFSFIKIFFTCFYLLHNMLMK